MSPAQAQHAVSVLCQDSARINRAIQLLITHANSNGLHPAMILGWLTHKFDVIEDGLAGIVLGSDEYEDEAPTVDIPTAWDYDPTLN